MVELTQQLFDDQAASIARLETELATEKAAHLATLQINARLQEQIEAFEMEATRPKVAAVVKVPGGSFKVDDIEYVITVPAFHYGGNKITAEQLLENKELQVQLVKAEVGFLKPKGAK